MCRVQCACAARCERSTIHCSQPPQLQSGGQNSRTQRDRGHAHAAQVLGGSLAHSCLRVFHVLTLPASKSPESAALWWGRGRTKGRSCCLPSLWYVSLYLAWHREERDGN